MAAGRAGKPAGDAAARKGAEAASAAMTAKPGKGPGPDEGQRPARRGVVLTLLGIGLVAAAYVVTIVVMVVR